MEIVIYSDFACPFCYIGKKRLEKAIEKAGIEDVNYIYKSFLLNPAQSNDIEGRPVENLANKYNYSISQAQKMIDQVVLMAKGEGLEFDYENLKERNMVNAHRLLKLAIENGVGDIVVDKIYSAHLVEGKDLSDYDVLIDIGIGSGLDKKEIEELYSSDKYIDEIQNDMNDAINMGVNSVPVFIIDNEKSISGAQEVEKIVEMLER